MMPANVNRLSDKALSDLHTDLNFMSKKVSECGNILRPALYGGTIAEVREGLTKAHQLADDINGLQESWEQTKACLEKEKASLQALEEQIQEKESTKNNLDESLTKRRGEHLALEREHNSLSRSHVSLQQQMKSEEATRESLERKHVELVERETNIKNLLSDYERKESELCTRQVHHSEAEKSLKERERAIAQAELDSSELKARLDSRDKAMESVSRECDERAKKLDDLASSLTTREKGLESGQSTLQESLRKLADDKRILESERQKSEEQSLELARLRSQAEQKGSELNKNLDKIGTVRRIIHQLLGPTSLAGLTESESDSIEDTIGSLGLLQGEMRRLQDAESLANATLKQTKADNAKETARWSEAQTNLKRSLEKEQQERESTFRKYQKEYLGNLDLAERFASCEKDRRSLSDQLERKDQDLQSLRLQVTAIKLNRDRHQRHAEELETAHAHSSQTFQQEHDQLRRELEASRDQLETARENLVQQQATSNNEQMEIVRALRQLAEAETPRNIISNESGRSPDDRIPQDSAEYAEILWLARHLDNARNR